MLVLTRKQNQEILIGDNIKITVLKMKGNTVRLGIEAPRDINVVRGELPRLATKSKSTPEPAELQEAEFTVVFSNSDESQKAKADVIPFLPNQAPTERNKNNELPTETRRLSDESPNCQMDPMRSIQFRGNLPAELHHNRLKEIVDKLTANPENSSI